MATVIALSKIAGILKRKTEREKLLESTMAMCSVCQEDMDHVTEGKFRDWPRSKLDEDDEIGWYGTMFMTYQQGGSKSDPKNYRLICNVCGPKIEGDKKGVSVNAYHRYRILAAIDRMKASGNKKILDGDDLVSRFVKDAIEEYIERHNTKVKPVVKEAIQIDVNEGEWDEMFRREMFDHLHEGFNVIERIKTEVMKITSQIETSQEMIKNLEGGFPPATSEIVNGALIRHIEVLRKEEFGGSDFILTFRDGERRTWLEKLESDESEKERTVPEEDTEPIRDWSSEDKQ
tara:strand:+ start:2013 stop:2879 length:867 start_codon:yes stop_codon:yes gene_type:complete